MNEIQVDQNGKPNKMSEDDKKLHRLKNIYKGKQIKFKRVQHTDSPNYLDKPEL